MAIEAELKQRKLEELKGIRKFANDYESKGYITEYFSTDTIDRMLKGKFKTYDELDSFNVNDSVSNDEVLVLYRNILDKENKQNTIIECIFIE